MDTVKTFAELHALKAQLRPPPHDQTSLELQSLQSSSTSLKHSVFQADEGLVSPSGSSSAVDHPMRRPQIGLMKAEPWMDSQALAQQAVFRGLAPSPVPKRCPGSASKRDKTPDQFKQKQEGGNQSRPSPRSKTLEPTTAVGVPRADGGQASAKVPAGRKLKKSELDAFDPEANWYGYSQACKVESVPCLARLLQNVNTDVIINDVLS